MNDYPDTLLIYRFADFGEGGGMLSRWRLGRWECWGLECPWNDDGGNAPSGLPFVSCIPPGCYRLEPHSGDRFKDTFAFVSETNGVAHWPSDQASRYACVIHRARNHLHLTGCLAPGTGLVLDDGMPTLTGSAVAVQHILTVLDWPGPKQAIIQQCLGGVMR